MSDMDKFLTEYKKDECSKHRCLNRHDMLIETGAELRDALALLKKIMQRAKEHPGDRVSREIYVAIANYNLGHRGQGAELPRASQR